MATRSTPRTPPTSYAHLQRVGDQPTRDALKLILDRLGALETTAAAGASPAALSQPLDTGGHGITGLPDPTDDSEPVTLAYLRQYVEAVTGSVSSTGAITAGTPTTTPTTPPEADPPPATDPSGTPAPPVTGPYAAPGPGTGTIRISGKYFYQGSSLWSWRGATDFLLFKNYLDGGAGAVDPIVAQRLGLGANIVRVLGMFQPVTAPSFPTRPLFNPAAYPTYFAQLTAFAAYLNGKGLLLEFVVFADAGYGPLNMTSLTAQKAHFASVVTAIGSAPNCFIELVNEYPFNGIDPSRFTKPTGGILYSRGSNGEDALPPVPPWDYCAAHSSRDSEWPRKSKDLQDLREGFSAGPTNPAWPALNRPVVDDEPIGAAETGIPGRRSATPDDFFWYAAAAQMFGAGATFHCDSGLVSELYGPTQFACAQSFFQGIAAVPVAAQQWNYTRTGFSDLPIVGVDLPDPAGTLRTYAKISGNTAIALAIRPAAGWTAIPQNGWTIVSATGPSGSLVTLTR